MKIIVKLKSKAKPRQRIVYKKNGAYAYYDPCFKKYEESLMYLLQQKKIKFDFSKPFMIDIKLNKDSIELNFRRCKGIKNIRGDVDNHIKGILDALQKAYNFNDKNCYAVSCVAYDARG